MPITEFLGRLHPLLVHLPIGILLFAVGLMAYGYVKKVDVAAAVSLAWGLGAFSALLACGAGWLLAQSGEYDADMVTRHQWTGLATAGLATLTFLLKRYRWPVALTTVVFLSVAGHYGGNLTHGEDYLFPADKQPARLEQTTQPMLKPEAVTLTTDSINTGDKPIIRRTFFYRDQVMPILKTRCYTCHSVTKKKGGLRLDTEAFIRQGGKNGSVLTAGNPQKSKLFTYLLLPDDDDRHMPPRGKLQLTPRQIAVLHHWIQKGASFREEVEVIQPTTAGQLATVAGVVPSLSITVPIDSGRSKTAGTDVAPVSLEARLLAQPVAAPNPDAVAKLKQQQISVSKLVSDAQYLSVNFVNVSAFTSGLLTELAEIGPQVVHLRLSGQPVSDEDVKPLVSLKNLTRLNLDHTRITDAGLASLAALPNLEQLNLYGTAITDVGLDELARYPNLNVVYLWQTQTTPDGIRRLQKARPNLKLVTGAQQLDEPVRAPPGLARPGLARPDTNKALSTRPLSR